MGQVESSFIDNFDIDVVHHDVLTLEYLATQILINKIKRIVVVTGAGVSVAAGIPDFRSMTSGIYKNLDKYKLDQPEDIFSFNHFKQKPSDFMDFAKAVFPKPVAPTITHFFIELFEYKGLLVRHYTQNIDSISKFTTQDNSKLVELHGTFDTAHCLVCKKEFKKEEYASYIKKGCVKHCNTNNCIGYVKPDIVFYGEGVKQDYLGKWQQDMENCDLVIIIGTSLEVEPISTLVNSIPLNTLRLLINKEAVEPFKSNFDFDSLSKSFVSNYKNIRDVFYCGDCDEGCIAFSKYLHWENDLLKLIQRWKENHPKIEQSALNEKLKLLEYECSLSPTSMVQSHIICFANLFNIGHLCLNNLEINKSILKSSSLPFELARGFVGTLSLEFGYSSILGSEPIRIQISDVNVIVRPHSKTTSQELYDLSMKNHQSQVDMAEVLRQMNIQFLENNSKKEETNTFMKRIIENIINNLNVTISTIYVCIEDDLCTQKYLLGCYIETISLNNDFDGSVTYPNINKYIDIGEISLFYKEIENKQSHIAWTSLSSSELSFYIQLHNATYTGLLSFSSIYVSISANIITQISSLLTVVHVHQSRLARAPDRLAFDVEQNRQPKNMWKYLYSCISEDISQTKGRYNRGNLHTIITKGFQYKSLYKSFTKKNMDSLHLPVELLLLERNLPAETLMFWRNMADYELYVDKSNSNNSSEKYYFVERFSKPLNMSYAANTSFSHGNLCANKQILTMDSKDPNGFPRLNRLLELKLNHIYGYIHTGEEEKEIYIGTKSVQLYSYMNPNRRKVYVIKKRTDLENFTLDTNYHLSLKISIHQDNKDIYGNLNPSECILNLPVITEILDIITSLKTIPAFQSSSSSSLSSSSSSSNNNNIGNNQENILIDKYTSILSSIITFISTTHLSINIQQLIIQFAANTYITRAPIAVIHIKKIYYNDSVSFPLLTTEERDELSVIGTQSKRQSSSLSSTSSLPLKLPQITVGIEDLSISLNTSSSSDLLLENTTLSISMILPISAASPAGITQSLPITASISPVHLCVSPATLDALYT
ncbi:hypothetical protein WA158_008034 [Blastocystis sp. Blastoise]